MQREAMKSTSIATQPLTALEVTQRYKPSAPAAALLREKLLPARYFELLCEQRLHGDAIRFVAHLLAKREAVWWGTLCVWQTLRVAKVSTVEEKLLKAILAWILQPGEGSRRATLPLAQAAEITTPAGCLGWAVFWSTGSMHAPDLPVVAPPAYLTNHTVAGAILMAVATGPESPTRRELQFLRMGIEVANGVNLPPSGGSKSQSAYAR